jgi:sporulation protein YlmC with PRC-barrel domain
MADADLPHTLITASRVNGTPVYNRAGERIGHIEDLSIDKVSGQVRFALLAFGRFLGIGDRFHPLPWSVLEYDTHKNGYVIPLEKSELEKAPHYAKDEMEAYGGGDQVKRAAPFL